MEKHLVKDCPFCGGVASLGNEKIDSTQCWTLGCHSCEFVSKEFHTELDALVWWNSRTHTATHIDHVATMNVFQPNEVNTGVPKQVNGGGLWK